MKHKLLNPLRLLMIAICMLGLATEGQEVIQDDFTFRLDPISQTATCLNYFGSSEAPVMPTYITEEDQQYPVTFIWHYAFANATFNTITLPETLKKTGEMIFQNCSNLKSIIIPNSVDTMMVGAFLNCI